MTNPETRLVRAIMREITARGGWCVKFPGVGTAGIPDILVCWQGRFIALEVKTRTGKATPLQEHTIRKIIKAGGNATVVRSVEDALQAMMNGHDLLAAP